MYERVASGEGCWGGGAPVTVRGARWAPQSTPPLATGLGSRSRAMQLCKQEIPTPSQGGAALYRSDKNEEAKVGRSSDDAQRALLRLIQPANRVREPRVFGE